MPATLIAGDDTLVSTPPSGFVTVLKRIVIYKGTGSAVTVYDSSTADNTTITATEIMFKFNCPTNRTVDFPNLNIPSLGSGTSGKVRVDTDGDATAYGVVYYDLIGAGNTPA